MAKKNHFSLGVLIILFLVGCSALEPERGTVKVRLVDQMVIVYVPSGNFLMGSSEEDLQTALQTCTQFWFDCDLDDFNYEEPQHKVFVDGFWIDQTEVTNDQFLSCVSAGGCEKPHCLSELQFNRSEQPVVCVDWYQAEAYCNWAGGRLPTEAEWEYAARGKKGTLYPWGDEFVGEWLNYCDQSCNRPHSDPGWDDGQNYTNKVGSYDKGISWCKAADLAGNASEWVGDWFADYARGWKIDPPGPEDGELKTIRAAPGSKPG